MARSRLKLNHSQMRAMLQSDAVRAELTRRAERVLASAQADPHDDTYEYEQSLHIQQDTTDRAVVRVVSSDPKGGIVEANFGVLAKALDAAR